MTGNRGGGTMRKKEKIMQLFNSAQDYGAILKGLHWFTVVLVVLAWVLGIFGDDLPEGDVRRTGLFVHISAGLAVFAMLAARILWRVVDKPPAPEPARFGPWPDRLAALAHLALYVLLVAVPVVGIVLQFARGDALPLFGLGEIASPWIKDRAFAHGVKEVHEVLAHALVALAAFHAAAALIHHWLLGDRTLVRMLPISDKSGG
jgi:cytochrome b561